MNVIKRALGAVRNLFTSRKPTTPKAEPVAMPTTTESGPAPRQGRHYKGSKPSPRAHARRKARARLQKASRRANRG